MKYRISRLILSVFVMVLVLSVSVLSQDKKPGKPKKPEGLKRRPLVVLKQTVIEGRVFFISTGKKDDEVAVKLRIEVRTIEESDRIFKTKTNEEGKFTLPNLETGTYHLVIGKLVLKLQIEEGEKKEGPSKSIPKKLLVFIPRELKA